MKNSKLAFFFFCVCLVYTGYTVYAGQLKLQKIESCYGGILNIMAMPEYHIKYDHAVKAAQKCVNKGAK